ncbi:DUF2812 domain-containing protein [Metasolibacillus sp.]|uniref:DUF2812 domain-containing protein n=1 Tax=Metasolibacillus sp. TaxID=2703680 RepID=UPI0025D6FECE|nr:DUF2812 domain-containing protein [Metasolibacillus sp.]MCT6924364.1 DUF2812 domain-containing protein [Metasolibacillus sp.]MCT6940549.1 DUF2812 domain-containing protein [Metasolibacillus sp.]
MKKTIYRFFVDDAKEEAWLNEMSAQGWHFQKMRLCFYTFVKDESQQYIYRLELINGQPVKEQKEYITFLEDSGITIVQQFGGWIYTRKNATAGSYELFSDYTSKITYTKKELKISAFSLFPMAILGIVNFINAANRDDNFSYVCLLTAILCMIASILIILSTYQLYQRKKALEKQQQLFE